MGEHALSTQDIRDFKKALRQCLKANGLKECKDKQYAGQTNIEVYCLLRYRLIQVERQQPGSLDSRLKRQLQPGHQVNKWRNAIWRTLQSLGPGALNYENRALIERLLQVHQLNPTSIIGWSSGQAP